MKPQPERGILRDPLRHQTKTSNSVSKIHCQGERVNGSPGTIMHALSTMKDSASLRPNRFTGRSSSSTTYDLLVQTVAPLLLFNLALFRSLVKQQDCGKMADDPSVVLMW